MADLSVKLSTIDLRNPVMPASGTFGWARELEPYVDVASLGALVTKSITLSPMDGNPPPRTAETPCGLVNSIGLQNPGIEFFLEEHLPRMRAYGVPLVVSIAGFSVEEYVQLAARLDRAEGVSAMELNVSCPNVKGGGFVFGRSPETLSALVAAVRRATRLPLAVKLSPNVQDIGILARTAERYGADALTVANTLRAAAVNWRTRRPLLSTVTGGLSGPAVKPHALYLVREARKAVSIPIIGCGGIASADDVLEFIVCGASAVQVGAASLVDPGLCGRLPAEIDSLLAAAGIMRLRDLVGSLEE